MEPDGAKKRPLLSNSIESKTLMETENADCNDNLAENDEDKYEVEVLGEQTIAGPSRNRKHPKIQSPQKNRDYSKVGRRFNPDWTEQFMVIESIKDDIRKPLCVICHKQFSQMKVYHVRRHYNSFHKESIENNFPLGSQARKTELSRLIEECLKTLKEDEDNEKDGIISILTTPDLNAMRNYEDDDIGESDDYEFPLSNGVNCNPTGELNVQNLEEGFFYLDKFLSFIKENDPNIRRSYKVRTAIEVSIDVYKRLLKKMKNDNK
ncbi:hypothetical protein BLOT_003409 [Blomia tropicalis]|nr:hypothetical protein BLOT_003409 [Blomia tropicalis]